jgi:hypothetical protein
MNLGIVVALLLAGPPAPLDAAQVDKLREAAAKLERGDAKAALAALEGTDALADRLVAQPLLLGRARLGTGDVDGAYATLEAATRHFPDDIAPRLELVAICVDQELHEAARAWAQSVLDLRGAALERDTAEAIMTALWRDRSALPVLEDLALRFDGLRAHLAWAWSSHGHWYTAATLFDRASGSSGAYAFEAADQYRLAGFTARALRHNARVRDDGKRIDQRIDILFGAAEMARVVALEPAAILAGAMRTATRVRLAEAHWRLGNHVRAAALARELLGGDQASRARALLGAMGRDAEESEEP